MTLRIVAIFVFLAAACTLWRPFDIWDRLYSTRNEGAMPAGEIRSDFEVRQAVTPPETGLVEHRSGRDFCFGILFATYARSNSGQLEVSWRQQERMQRWRIEAADLVDNDYRHFCPDAAFAVDQPFALGVSGIDGKAGDSATLWLGDDTRFGTAVSPAVPAGKALRLQVIARDRIGPASILRVDHGAFLFGWLCTVAIGLVALVHGFRRGGDAGGDAARY